MTEVELGYRKNDFLWNVYNSSNDDKIKKQCGTSCTFIGDVSMNDLKKITNIQIVDGSLYEGQSITGFSIESNTTIKDIKYDDILDVSFVILSQDVSGTILSTHQGGGKGISFTSGYDAVDMADDSSEMTKKCKNYIESIKLLNKTRVHHGSDERYENTTSVYNRRFLEAANLAGGILVGLYFIFRSFSQKEDSKEEAVEPPK